MNRVDAEPAALRCRQLAHVRRRSSPAEFSHRRAGFSGPGAKKTLPRIAGVVPDEGPLTLQVRWREGGETLVDVSGPIGAYRVYAPLRADQTLFRQVRIGGHGTDIVWTDAIDMAADTLWRLAREQSGETLTAEAFRAWRKRNAYTLDGAARALGLSRRMVAYYEQGEKPIPRTVALATRALQQAGLESERAV